MVLLSKILEENQVIRQEITCLQDVVQELQSCARSSVVVAKEATKE